MISLSNTNQLEALCVKQDSHNCPIIETPPSWLVICGLGGEHEVVTAHKYWPGTRIVGIDFDPRIIKSCRRIWRKSDILIEAALSDEVGSVSALMAEESCCTLHPQMVEKASSITSVQTTPLDTLSAQYGPFDGSVLWIDTEGSDCRVVAGAKGLFERGSVLAVVVEIWTARPDLMKEYTKMRSFLASAGFHLADILNGTWWGHNEIWVCDDYATRIIKAG